MIIWIIGKSGSGKTFYGKKIYSLIRKNKKIHLDGDEIRKYISGDLGYSIKDRKINSTRIINLCKFLESKNYIVICSILSIFRDHQKKNKTFFNKYMQIFIDAKDTTLINRDKKNIYSIKNNIVGKDIKFSKPINSDLVIKAEDTVDMNIKKIKKLINDYFKN